MSQRGRSARYVVAGFFAIGMIGLPIPVITQAPQKQHAAWVSVTDASGNPVAGLTTEDFVVREDKVAREVLSVTPATDPMQIAVLIDNSQAAEAYQRDYREALAAFLTAIAAEPTPKGKHEVALIALASRPTILKDYTTDQAQLMKTALGLFSMPGTGVYLLDGISETSQGITKRGAMRPVILAIATEASDLSNLVFEPVLNTLHTSGAALHVVVVGRPTNTSHDRAIVIDEGTRSTGGRNEDIFTSTALTNLLKQIANDITHQYRVTYSRPQSLIPPSSLTVSVNKTGLTARATAVKEERPSTEKR